MDGAGTALGTVLIVWLVTVRVVCGHSTVNPGLRLRVSQTGLDYAANTAIGRLATTIQGQSIADVHDSDHVKVGKVKYDLTQMKITSFTKPSSKVILTSSKGVVWSASGLDITVNGHWHYEYKWGFIKVRDSGTFDASADSVDFSASAILGTDKDGRPSIRSSGCDSNVGSMHVRFHGGASWLYNIFDHQIEKYLRNKLRDLMCKSTVKYINKDAEQALAKLKVLLPMGGHKHRFILDYRLVANPSFTDSYVESQHKGEVCSEKNPKDPPFTPEKMQKTKPISRMVNIWASDYVINSYAFSAFASGLLQYKLTKDSLPADKRDFLNTTCTKFGSFCIGNFLYPVMQKYPNASVMISMVCAVAPSVSVSETDISLTFMGNMTFHVQTQDGHTHYLFKTNTSAVTSLFIYMDDRTVKANMTHFKPHITVTDSAIGSISDANMMWIFRMAARNFIIPRLRELGSRGMDLPGVKETKFVRPVIKLLKNSVMFGSDIIWSPSFHVDLLDQLKFPAQVV